ncbi:hypothetical protein Bxe_B1917 [Paraburkholderia xenovorans LB400]|uniref:Uncharacterized protein n=1 Tax=Paraburkholderia xenovorans (strain LB400) TaxID=266265 RepID=Q13PD7_PARXL|nr:hypothetical protein Bxe_B1917 [Paraburkholderia xenovorans LB400]
MRGSDFGITQRLFHVYRTGINFCRTRWGPRRFGASAESSAEFVVPAPNRFVRHRVTPAANRPNAPCFPQPVHAECAFAGIPHDDTRRKRFKVNVMQDVCPDI